MSRLLLFATKDFRDSLRDNQLYYTASLFLLVALALGYVVGSNRMPAQALPMTLLGALLFLGPLAAIVVSYNDIVGKRASGELTVLLGLPFSRRQVVLGTFLGRFAVLGVLTAAAVVTAAVIALIVGGGLAADLLVLALLAALLVALAFVAIAVGISANTRNTTRAAGLAFGAFLLFVVRLWDAVPGIVNFALAQFGARPLPVGVVDVYHNLTPQAGVRNLLAAGRPVLELAFSSTVTGPTMGPLVGLLVLLAWIVLPVALGYWRFDDADL
ncbi:MAG: ABC transporter permease subunit [Haloarculaceae archaeon]